VESCILGVDFDKKGIGGWPPVTQITQAAKKKFLFYTGFDQSGSCLLRPFFYLMKILQI